MTTLVAESPIESPFAKPLDVKVLERSRSAYNALPDDCAQRVVADSHLQSFAKLFVSYKVDKILGVHLIHGHFEIPERTIMLGSNFENPCGRWTKPTDIDAVDLSAIHGHIFVLKDNEFLAYEYQDGPMPNLSDVGADFIREFVGYIKTHDLVDLIGIQVLTPAVEYGMMELILGQGTVMLDGQKARGCTPTRITGWRFEVRDGKPQVCAANETHATMTSGNHKVFNAGKPLPKLDTFDDVKKALAEEGVL